MKHVCTHCEIGFLWIMHIVEVEGGGQGMAADFSLQGTEKAVSTLSLTWRYCVQETGQCLL